MPEKKNDPDATGVTGPVPNAAWLGLIARGSPWGYTPPARLATLLKAASKSPGAVAARPFFPLVRCLDALLPLAGFLGAIIGGERSSSSNSIGGASGGADLTSSRRLGSGKMGPGSSKKSPPAADASGGRPSYSATF